VVSPTSSVELWMNEINMQCFVTSSVGVLDERNKAVFQMSSVEFWMKK
jgi:hypothetical protein